MPWSRKKRIRKQRERKRSNFELNEKKEECGENPPDHTYSTSPTVSSYPPSEECGLNMLILLEVINVIPVYQRYPLESVCRLFRRAVLKSYESVREIHLKRYYYELKTGRSGANSRANWPNANEKSKKRNNPRLKILLEKFGKYFPKLQKIQGLRYFAIKLNAPNFDLLGDLKSLTKISFKNLELDSLWLQIFLLKHRENLLELDLTNAQIVPRPNHDFGLHKSNGVLIRLKRLETLRVNNCQNALTSVNLRPTILAFLDVLRLPALKRFDMLKCGSFDAEIFRRFFTRCLQLDHVTFGRLNNRNEDDIRQFFNILSNSPSILTLTGLTLLGGCYLQNPLENDVINFLTSLMTSSIRKIPMKTLDFYPLCLKAHFLPETIFTHLPRLEELSLCFSYVPSRDLVKKLEGMTHLKVLRLALWHQRCWETPSPDGPKLDLSGLNFAGMTNLHKLDLGRFVTFDSTFCDSLSQLAEFTEFSFCRLTSFITFDIFTHLFAQVGQRLKSLTILECNGATMPQHVKTMAELCPNLKHLTLAEITLEDRSIEEIMKNCENLETFVLDNSFVNSRCCRFHFCIGDNAQTDDWLKFLTRCPKLTKLKLKERGAQNLWVDDRFQENFRRNVYLTCPKSDCGCVHYGGFTFEPPDHSELTVICKSIGQSLK